VVSAIAGALASRRAARQARVDQHRGVLLATNDLDATQRPPPELREGSTGQRQAERGVRFLLGGTAVELLSYRGAMVAPSPTGEQLGYRMMALEVEDMDKALAYLRTKGIDPSWGPRVTEGQYCRAEIRDPHAIASNSGNGSSL
jgi:hypothetical protein